MLDMSGFTCVATTWISKQDSSTFEALFGHQNGDIWHACFESSDQGDKLLAFEPLTKLLTLDD